MIRETRSLFSLTAIERPEIVYPTNCFMQPLVEGFQFQGRFKIRKETKGERNKQKERKKY
jgi:hypothetical protein